MAAGKARHDDGPRDLLILGTGVHAGEMVEIVERVNGCRPTWRLLGLVGADGTSGAELNGAKVLGGPDVIPKHPDAALVPDNEWPRDIELPNERLVSLVDPTVFVSRTATIGPGCVIYPNCFVGLRARIGGRVFSLSGCIINHDVVIEERCVLASAVTLAGHVHVEVDCYLGQSCTVRQYTRIGRGSLVGMGAVVVKDVEPGTVVAGCPARRLKDREA